MNEVRNERNELTRSAMLARTVELHERRKEVLLYLPSPDRDHIQPMDIGAWNGSYHSNDLRALEKKGLVESIHWGGWDRGSKRYRKTQAGVDYLANAKDRREAKQPQPKKENL
jgi:hypothetical protein